MTALCSLPPKYFVGGGRMMVVAERSIREGEEVCENYYPHYHYMGTRTRREWLRYQPTRGQWPLRLARAIRPI